MRSLWELDQAMHGKRLGTQVRLMYASLLCLLKGTDMSSASHFLFSSETQKGQKSH